MKHYYILSQLYFTDMNQKLWVNGKSPKRRDMQLKFKFYCMSLLLDFILKLNSLDFSK